MIKTLTLLIVVMLALGAPVLAVEVQILEELPENVALNTKAEGSEGWGDGTAYIGAQVRRIAGRPEGARSYAQSFVWESDRPMTGIGFQLAPEHTTLVQFRWKETQDMQVILGPADAEGNYDIPGLIFNTGQSGIQLTPEMINDRGGDYLYIKFDQPLEMQKGGKYVVQWRLNSESKADQRLFFDRNMLDPYKGGGAAQNRLPFRTGNISVLEQQKEDAAVFATAAE